MQCIHCFLHAVFIARTLHKDHIITAHIARTIITQQLSKSPEPKDSKWTPDQWQTNRQQTKNGQTNKQKTNEKQESQNTPNYQNHLSLKTPNGLLIRDWDGRTTNCDGGNGLSLRFNFFFRISFHCSILFSGPKWKMLLSKEEAFLYWKVLEKSMFFILVLKNGENSWKTSCMHYILGFTR